MVASTTSKAKGPSPPPIGDLDFNETQRIAAQSREGTRRAEGGGDQHTSGVLQRVADFIVPSSVPTTTKLVSGAGGVGATIAMLPLNSGREYALPGEANGRMTHTSVGAAGAETHEERSSDVDGQEDQDEDLLGEVGSGYTPYLGRLTAVACLGGLQFGWDTGIASGMLVAIHQDLGHVLSAAEQEIIVSATTVGAIIGALSAGRLSDWIGRKRVMVIAGVFFALGSVEQAASQVVRELVLGRVLVGLGVGAASMVVPTYLAE